MLAQHARTASRCRCRAGGDCPAYAAIGFPVAMTTVRALTSPLERSAPQCSRTCRFRRQISGGPLLPSRHLSVCCGYALAFESPPVPPAKPNTSHRQHSALPAAATARRPAFEKRAPSQASRTARQLPPRLRIRAGLSTNGHRCCRGATVQLRRNHESWCCRSKLPAVLRTLVPRLHGGSASGRLPSWCSCTVLCTTERVE